MTNLPGGMERDDDVRVHLATQNGAQLKTSGIFRVLFSDRGRRWELTPRKVRRQERWDCPLATSPFYAAHGRPGPAACRALSSFM